MSEAVSRVHSRRLRSNTDLKASNINVVQQAKLMDSAGTAWHAVKYGNLELIMKLFPSQCNVYNKGPVGENVFHIALLLNTPSTLAIAKYLVKLYGSTLVNTPYQERKHEAAPPGQYEGETAVHIAIVNRDFDMVKFLVQNSADVRARAYGAFFQEGSVVYYGEFPLSFAACTGQKDIVSYLKRHGARVNGDRDTSGNTALHMCVYHEQTDMYDHLVEYCGASEHVRNNRGQTPLLLAACLGKQEIFQHIYNKRRKVAWAYGPVTSYSLSLHEIDTVQSTRSFVPSSLEQIVRKAHVDILSDPLIKTLLETKWSRFAMAGFMIQMSLYALFVTLQTFLIWLHSDSELWNSYSREALEIVSLVFAVAFFFLEILDIHTWVVGVYNRRSFMKSNATHRPPLYPIPGDVIMEPTRVKSGFLSRIIKGAIAEGVGQTHPDPARLTVGLCSSTHSHGISAAAPPALNGGYIREGVRNAPTIASGPVGEGREQGPFAAGPAFSGQHSGPQPRRQGQSRPVAEGVERDSSVPMAPQPFYATSHQRLEEIAAQHLPPLAQPPKAYHPLYRQDSHMVDIVSVGLAGLHATPLMPSFIQQPPVTSMLGGGMPRNGKEGAGVYPADSLLGINLPLAPPPHHGADETIVASGPILTREGSGEISGEKGEIKNRLRGGGGGDLPIGGNKAMRPESTRKPIGNRDEKDDTAEDDRKPLHVEGFVGSFNTTLHATERYYLNQLTDPITLIMIAHILFTIVHFITWASAYGGIGGAGPSSEGTKQFDDIILSLVGLTGWASMLYFTRGHKDMGRMAVIMEHCLLDIIKFGAFFFVACMGFTLAFYTVLSGTTYTTNHVAGLVDPTAVAHRPFKNIGYGMIQIIRFLYGEANYDDYSATDYMAKEAFATIYFILYVFLVVLMLSYMLIAMVMHTFNTVYGHADKVWELRWATYVLRMERRLPLSWQQKYRLGEVSYDPQLQARVYNHVFEVVDDHKEEGGKGSWDQQSKALEAILDKMKKKGKNK